MQEASDIMTQLNVAGKRLSKGHRRIAQFIVEHYDKAAFMTAGRLGDSVGVSESTVVRFASALGYAGYPQLQRALQELVSHRLTANQRVEIATDGIAPGQVLPSVLKSDMQKQSSEEDKRSLSGGIGGVKAMVLINMILTVVNLALIVLRIFEII